MAALAIRVQDLAVRTATEAKALRTLLNGNAANLASLTTTAKGNLVLAINELDAAIDALSAASGAQINDVAVSSSTQTYSINKIKLEIQEAKDSILGGAAAALDTLAEIAAALGNDANFAASVTTALANRVRFDAAQVLTGPQQVQARTNIAAASATELATLTTNVGDTDTNFVDVFNTNLLT